MSAAPVRYVSGLDLGQAAEFTALAVLERAEAPDPASPGKKLGHYAVRHLERFPLGTPYPEVGARVTARFAAPPLAGSPLGVDQTAVGKPVLDLLRRARPRAVLRPVAVTAGHQAHADDGGVWLVPRKELVSTLQVLLQARRIRVAPSLPDSQTLVRELQNFKMKFPTISDPFEAWREGPHDDLVLAVAIAAWLGERGMKRLWIAV